MQSLHQIVHYPRGLPLQMPTKYWTPPADRSPGLPPALQAGIRCTVSKAINDAAHTTCPPEPKLQAMCRLRYALLLHELFHTCHAFLHETVQRLMTCTAGQKELLIALWCRQASTATWTHAVHLQILHCTCRRRRIAGLHRPRQRWTPLGTQRCVYPPSQPLQ